MRVLFLMRTPVYTPNFESTLRELAGRGHSVHVAFETREPKRAEGDDAEHIQRLCRECPSITFGDARPTLLRDPLAAAARRLREGIDYLRYLEPGYRDASKLRRRAAAFAPGFVRFAARLPLLRGPRGRAALRRALSLLERAIPVDPSIDSFLREHQPDVVLASPLVMFGTNQVDYLRRARRFGIRTGLCVYSWDSLTNKGVIHEVPDLVAVWNDAQRAEAVDLHGVPPSRVVLTGAPPYDRWFGWPSRTDRRQFCGRVGLDPELPIVLFVGSSRFIAADETSLVREWIAELRSERAHPALRRAGILVRPHPLNPCWLGEDLAGLDGVAVWPPNGELLADDEAKQDMFDSVHHATAVVGLNTSAMIDTAIIDRPIHTWLAPSFRGVQEGTPHFHYLSGAAGGPVRIAESLRDHVAQLAESMNGNSNGNERHRAFVRSFIRPHGLDEPASSRLASAIEDLAAQPPRPRRPRELSPHVYRALRPVADRVVALAGVTPSRDQDRRRL